MAKNNLFVTTKKACVLLVCVLIFFATQQATSLHTSSSPKGSSSTNPAPGCNWIKRNVKNAASGLYYVMYDVTTVIPVYCDMNAFVNGAAGTLVYKISAGKGFAGYPDSYELFYAAVPVNELNNTFLTNTISAGPYTSRLLANWKNTGGVTSQASIRVYNAGNNTRFADFNTTGRGYVDWFVRENIIASSWDATATTNYNVFGIAGTRHGSANRNWYINTIWNGCADDWGYLLVMSTADGCDVEYSTTTTPKPIIFYSAAVQATRVQTYHQGEVLALYIDIADIDVDECAAGIAVCPPGIACINTIDGYTCNCSINHALNDDHSLCIDIRPAVTGAVSIEPTSASRQTVAIYGRNFGPNSASIHRSATVGGFPCVSLKYISPTELHCTVVGHGANRDVEVIVNGVSSSLTPSSFARYDFPNPTVAGLESCVPPFGSVDVTDPTRCNCWSGHTSSNSILNNDCNVHAHCAAHASKINVVGMNTASRPQTQFKDDKFFIRQTMPIVHNRRDTQIQLAVPNIPYRNPATAPGTTGATTCFYPGTLWEKKINELDCVEEYFGVIPWTQHEMCGFVEDVSTSVLASSHKVYVSSLVTSYTESIKAHNGEMMLRKMQDVYQVTVTFVKQIKAFTSTNINVIIADPTAATSLNVEINGDVLYDVSTKNVFITFTTSLVWPYQIQTKTPIGGSWYPKAGQTGLVGASITNSNDDGSASCNKAQDSECEQVWILTVNTKPNSVVDPVCNLAGKIEFSTGVLECRDHEPTNICSGNVTTNFTINIGKTDLCDNAPDVDATKGTLATLTAFYDKDYTIPQSVFQTGDMVYFMVTVNDPLSSIDAITFNSITVNNDVLQVSDTIYRVQNPGDLPTASTTTLLSIVGANLTEIRQPRDVLSPNTDGVLYFWFKLNRKELNVVKTLSTQSLGDDVQVINVEAIVDVFYHGNNKRSIVPTTQGSQQANTHISLIKTDDDDIAEKETIANNINNDDEADFSLFSAENSANNLQNNNYFVNICILAVSCLAIFCM